MGNVTKIIHKKGGVKSIIDLNKTTNITQNIITNSTYQIGEYKESNLPLSDNETLTLMDGRILSNNSYELLFNHIRELLKTNPELFTDINTYNLEVEETGECHKFVYQSYQENDENYTLKLPTYDNSEIFHYICTRLKNTNTDKNLVKAEVNETYVIDPELADTFYITLTQADCHISIKQPTKPDFKYDLDVYFYQKVGNAKVTFDQNVRGIRNDRIEITHARDYVTYIKLTSITQGNVWMYRKIDTWYGATLSDVKAPQYKVTLALSGVGSTDWGRSIRNQSSWQCWAIPNNITFRDVYTDEPMNLKTYYGNQFIIGSRNLTTDTYKECIYHGASAGYNIGTPSQASQQAFDQYKMLETDIKGYFTYYSVSWDIDSNHELAKTLSKNYASFTVGERFRRDTTDTNWHWTIVKPTMNTKFDVTKPGTIYYTLYTNHPMKEISFKYGRSACIGDTWIRTDHTLADNYDGEGYKNYSGVSAQKIKADLYYDDHLVKSQIFDIPNNGGETQCVLNCNDLVTDWQAELDAIEAENARLLAIEKAKSFVGVFNVGENTHAEVYRYITPVADESGSSTETENSESTESTEALEPVLTKIYTLMPGENEVVLKYDDIVRIYNDSEREDVKFSYNKSVFKNKIGDFTSGNVLTYKTEDYYEMEIFRIYDGYVLNLATCQGAGSIETDGTTFVKLIRNNLINKFISFNEICYFDDIEIGDVVVPSSGSTLTFEKCNLVETGNGTNQFIVSELFSNYKIKAVNGTLSQASGLVQTKDSGDIRIFHKDTKLVDIQGNAQETITLSVGDFIETNNVLSVKNVNLQDYNAVKKVVTAVFDDFVIVSQDVISNVADTANGLVHNRVVELLENASAQETNIENYKSISNRTYDLNSNDLMENINNNINILKSNINDLELALSDAIVFDLDQENVDLFRSTIAELSDVVTTLENPDNIDKYEIAIRRALNSLKALNIVQNENLDSRYKGLVTKYNEIDARIPVIKTTENINNDVTDICDMIDTLNSDITQYETLHSEEFSKYTNEYDTNLQLILNNVDLVGSQYNVVSTGSVITNIDSVKRAIFDLKEEVEIPEIESGTESSTEVEIDPETAAKISKNNAIDACVVKLVNARNSIEEVSNDIVQKSQTFNSHIFDLVEMIKVDFEALRVSDSVKIDNILDIVRDNNQIRTLILSVGEYDSQYTDPIITETGVELVTLDYKPIESSTETESGTESNTESDTNS
jgi:hypothetical protein